MQIDQNLLAYLQEKAGIYPNCWFESFKHKLNNEYTYIMCCWATFKHVNKIYKRFCMEYYETTEIHPNKTQSVERLKKDLLTRMQSIAVKVRDYAKYHPNMDIEYDPMNESEMAIDNVNNGRWLVERFPAHNCTEVWCDLPIKTID